MGSGSMRKGQAVKYTGREDIVVPLIRQDTDPVSGTTPTGFPALAIKPGSLGWVYEEESGGVYAVEFPLNKENLFLRCEIPWNQLQAVKEEKDIPKING